MERGEGKGYSEGVVSVKDHSPLLLSFFSERQQSARKEA